MLKHTKTKIKNETLARVFTRLLSSIACYLLPMHSQTMLPINKKLPFGERVVGTGLLSKQETQQVATEALQFNMQCHQGTTVQENSIWQAVFWILSAKLPVAFSKRAHSLWTSKSFIKRSADNEGAEVTHVDERKEIVCKVSAAARVSVRYCTLLPTPGICVCLSGCAWACV